MCCARIADRAERAGGDEADRLLRIMVAADADDELRLDLQRRDHRRRHGIGHRGDAQRLVGLPLPQLAHRRRHAVGIVLRQCEPPHLRQFRHQHDEAGAGEGAGQRLQAWLVAAQHRRARHQHHGGAHGVRRAVDVALAVGPVRRIFVRPVGDLLPPGRFPAGGDVPDHQRRLAPADGMAEEEEPIDAASSTSTASRPRNLSANLMRRAARSAACRARRRSASAATAPRPGHGSAGAGARRCAPPARLRRHARTGRA